jgi:hypothetical protein
LPAAERDFVDERIEDERERVAARRAMRTGRHAERHQRRLEVVVRDEARRELDAGMIRRVGEALLALRIVTVADEVVAPGDKLARRIDTRLEEMEAAGTIVVVPHVVFARPQDLDRHTDLLGDRRGLPM